MNLQGKSRGKLNFTKLHLRFALITLLAGCLGTCMASPQVGSGGTAAGANSSQTAAPATAGDQTGQPEAGQSTAPATAAGQQESQPGTAQSSALAGGKTPASSRSEQIGPSRRTPTSSNLTTSAPSCSPIETFLTQSDALMAPGQETGQRQAPTIQQQVPYGNLPSLRALYTQVPFAGARLQRFGCDAFLFGTGNANQLPIDIPVGPDYVLGPGDGIQLNLWGSQPNRLNEAIDPQGKIALPEAGTITINGMTIADAQKAIQAQLDTQFKDEHAEISLGRVRTVRVYIVGDVQRPGAYDVSSLSTPLGALFAAGGPTNRGSLRILKQYRGSVMVRQFDLYDFLLKGVRSDDRMLPGDTLLVPPVGPEVTIEGMVHRPAIYELNGEQTLSQVLDLAGGVLRTASLKEVKVQRIVAHESRTMLSLNLSGDPAQVQQQLAAFKVESGDDVVVAQILPYTQKTVFLDGHIYRPGLYPFRQGMTVSDLVHSQDVLPEPADRAEIVHLVPPDYHPETILFDLKDALDGKISIPLQPFDLVRVYGRYQRDAPTVTIDGDVLRPASYPMSEGMTVADLVRMAGGFTRSAYRAEADLSSYVIEDGKRVLVGHQVVDVAKALGGDQAANVVLKPGDVLGIRRLAGWQDIGSMVTINGEVQFAGAYALTPGERLSSVLKRAGGFTRDAYPPAAVLERVQVRELAEKARQQMITRVENTPIQYRQGTMDEQAAAAMELSLERQKDEALAALRSEPVSGRLVINISADIKSWENTPADIELRAGDVLTIPKRPNFVVVDGQIFNPGAISYVPGRTVLWYLRRTGGPTRIADKRNIYVLHADGSVTPRQGGPWGRSDFDRMRMRPGDTILVPEKAQGNSQAWQNIVGVTQVVSAAAYPVALAGIY